MSKARESYPAVSGRSGACDNYKKYKPFYMVPWDGETYIKIYANSREEMLDKVFGIASKIAGHITKEILKEDGLTKEGRRGN